LFQTRADLPLVKKGDGEEGGRESTFMNMTMGTWMPTVRGEEGGREAGKGGRG